MWLDLSPLTYLSLSFSLSLSLSSPVCNTTYYDLNDSSTKLITPRPKTQKRKGTNYVILSITILEKLTH
jgi:hypothetical protein